MAKCGICWWQKAIFPELMNQKNILIQMIKDDHPNEYAAHAPINKDDSLISFSLLP